MSHMGISHKQIIVAYLGNTLILLGSPVHRGKLSNGVSVTNFKSCYLGRIFFILRVFANGGELIDTIILPNGSRPFNNNMGAYDRTGINFYISTYDRKSTD